MSAQSQDQAVQQLAAAVVQAQQIFEAAKSGDKQAMQIAQQLQSYMEQMSSESQQPGAQASQAYRDGGAIDYLRRAAGICPEGYEVVFHKQGGKVCPVCQQKNGGQMKRRKAEPKDAVSRFKAKRCAGGRLRK